jgi:hypothetical protein
MQPTPVRSKQGQHSSHFSSAALPTIFSELFYLGHGQYLMPSRLNAPFGNAHRRAVFPMYANALCCRPKAVSLIKTDYWRPHGRISFTDNLADQGAARESL